MTIIHLGTSPSDDFANCRVSPFGAGNSGLVIAGWYVCGVQEASTHVQPSNITWLELSNHFPGRYQQRACHGWLVA